MPSDDINLSKSRSKPIMSRLKEETGGHHSEIESLPFFKALGERRLPLTCYVNQLKALAVMHDLFETRIAASKDDRVLSIWDESLKKLPLLREDINFFATRVISDAAIPVEAAQAMTEDIRRKQIEHPVSLLGYLYVLEGSTLGNSKHLPDIWATFHLNALCGCRYYSSYRKEVRGNWDRFSKKMNDTLCDPAIHAPVIKAAHEAFAGLMTLYMVLYPQGENEKSLPLTLINPEAGNHPIPDNEPEINAALRASNRGWNEFPYYEKRFGERGRRFSDSDTCWLATLPALGQEDLQGQIDWLCRILATRGMPSVLMEHILRFLYEELTAVVPENEAIYRKLQVSANFLENARERRLSQEKFFSLAGEFESGVGLEMSKQFRNTGKLLIAAVGDEKNGIEGAVAALRKWLTDSERFPDDWISAVNETLENGQFC